MNAIKKFEIVGMSASGFKCYGDNITAEFGSPTVITGGNGRGKSSVASRSVRRRARLGRGR